MSIEETSGWQVACARLTFGQQPEIGLVLGSGLGSIVDLVKDQVTVEYREVPLLPVSRVQGHAGKFVAGVLAGVPVILACGRVHAYEGHPAGALGAHVRFLAQAGVRTVLLTNAAGSLNESFAAGTWMMLTDHINWLSCSPLEGKPKFIDMTKAYDLQLREIFQNCAKKLQLELNEGVYAAVRGPQYETPAEIKMLRQLGADAVGMSTVPEVIQARALGVRVAAFSCLTNLAAGISGDSLSHDEVVEVGKKAAASFSTLLTDVLAKIK